MINTFFYETSYSTSKKKMFFKSSTIKKKALHVKILRSIHLENTFKSHKEDQEQKSMKF